jgi:hypothetical protein
MKQLLLILAVVMDQSVVAADKKPFTKEESAKIIETAMQSSKNNQITPLLSLNPPDHLR